MLVGPDEGGWAGGAAVFEPLLGSSAPAGRRIWRQNRLGGRGSLLDPDQAAHVVGEVGQRDVSS